MKDINNEVELEYYCDEQRHLVCIPYNVENLHLMATDLGIKRSWFHRKRNAKHYDIPKLRFKEICEKCNLISGTALYRIIKDGTVPILSS